MKVLVTGSTGFIGSALVPFLAARGDSVVRLVRSEPAEASEVRWDVAARRLDPAQLEGIDAAVHLAGENIVAGRWTEARRRRILESRTKGTRLLCETLARLQNPPNVLVSASAIGYYGNRGSEVLTEDSLPGSGFLAGVVRQWEAATEAAFQKGIRIVKLRMGMVMAPDGGALAKMLLPFRLGLGGAFGPGDQYVSWITRDDAVGAIYHALVTDSLAGPVNAVAPESVTNRELARALGRALGRPAVFRAPAFLLRLAFGRMADETVLASQRVRPDRLIRSGYRFRNPELESALRDMLKNAH